MKTLKNLNKQEWKKIYDVLLEYFQNKNLNWWNIILKWETKEDVKKRNDLKMTRGEYLELLNTNAKETLKIMEKLKTFIYLQFKKMLENTILDYFANAISASEIAGKFNLNEEKTKEILWYAQRERDDALIDEEGATLEQDLALDLVISRAVEALEEMAKKESN